MSMINITFFLLIAIFTITFLIIIAVYIQIFIVFNIVVYLSK